MVDPIYIVAAALGVGFAIGILGNIGRNFAGGLTLATIAFMSFVSAQWFAGFYFGNVTSSYIFTAGFQPPLSINLLMGAEEAFLTFIVNLLGFLGGIYLFVNFKRKGRNAFVIYLVLLMGFNVVIMTRDIFNLFVFLEITSIATAGLILIEKGNRAVGAGFKYLLATSIISSMLLIGIIFAYFYTGTLNIDMIIESNLKYMVGGPIIIFLILISAILELKPFPANGWGLDVYEGAHQGFSAIVSAGTATASLYMLYKLLPIASPEWSYYIALLGAITFIGANLLGVKQRFARRVLAYSSVGQLGLLMLILGLRGFLGSDVNYVFFGILITNILAKTGFFWLVGIVKANEIKEWAILRRKPFLLFLMGVFIFALVGFPPFPSFFSKWTFVMDLANHGLFGWISVIIVGSFLEAVYLMRWFGYAVKAEDNYKFDFKIQIHKIVPIIILTALLFVIGYFTAQFTEAGAMINFIPLLFVALLYFADELPVFAKNTIAILGMGIYFYFAYPQLDNLRLIFEVIFIIGGILTLIAGYKYKGKRQGFYPVALLMFAGLAAIIEAKTTLEFFYGWELMTAGSYFLIIRGKKSMPHALSYMLFSLGGAYALLMAFSIANIGQAFPSLDILNNISNYPVWAYGLLLAGFLTKTASVGLHIWLPGAHGEAESDVSPMVSAILLKAGVFGVLLTLIGMG
ncbi:MAG: hypothetical protein JXR34_09320, partial [Bacteroidales bacterium]|nr:hypothetical protein [Bacteroidales bacterium]